MTAAIAQALVTAAGMHHLDPKVVGAIVRVESAGNPYAWNPEPRYRWVWNVRTWAPFRALRLDEVASEVAPADFPSLAGDRDQEWWAQQASWGLMQVMGAVARERGFRGLYLTQLVDPATNLDIGCGHLAALLRWAEGDLVQACAAWNGGKAGNERPPLRNQDYADKVLRAMAGVQ